MMPLGSLRLRMMLLFSAVVGVLLAGSYAAFYLLLDREVRAQLDRQLLGAARPVLADLLTDPNEQDVNELNVPDEYFEIVDPSGSVLERSRNLSSRPLDLDSGRFDPSRTTYVTLAGPTGEGAGTLRVVLIPYRLAGKNLILALGMPTRDMDQALASFRRIVWFLLPVALLVTAAVSAWYVGRSLAPVAGLTRQAAAMAARMGGDDGRDLWTPLEVANSRDELGLLAGTFNRLFERINAVVGQLRQFVSDASHELRTPLSVLQGETELLLSQPRSVDEYEKNLATIHGELGKLSRIVEGLFTLSMADAGQLRLAREPLYLNEVLEEACALVAPRAQAKGIALERQTGAEMPYVGDEVFLRDLFLILLENAVKYSPSGTQVRVRLEREDGFVRVKFHDQGAGISSEHLPHIFDRFYRVAQPGAGEAKSGGLGLAIAQAIAQAQRGSIRCESKPGAGSTFTLSLPLS